MLAKWFKGKNVPKNDGVSHARKLERPLYVKVFELELSNMEDTPVYRLSHQLSIGSEIGNIVISDPSVSPRHASFSLNQDVVSVIDHGSVAGTFVNGQKIPPGKTIILEESDVVMIGDLEVRLRVGLQALKSEEVQEEREAEEEEPPGFTAGEEQEEEAPAMEPREVKVPAVPVNNKKDIKMKPRKVMESRETASNSLLRVFAIIGDLLLSYTIIIIFMPFDEFRDFVNSVPESIGSVLDFETAPLLDMFEKELSFLSRIGKETYEFLSSFFTFVPLLVVYGFVRFASTLILGVSVSQFFLGIRAVGNGIWKRPGGALRVLIGFFTWPLIIFDLPSILSRRTFKEVITLTHLHTPSKLMALLGFVLYLPLAFGFVLIAPLVQGLEIQEPLLVHENLDKRVKVKQPDEVPTEEAVPSEQIEAGSTILEMKLSYHPADLTIIPDFKFKGGQNTLKVGSALVFYQRDIQRPVEMELIKTFDLKQLLLIGMRGNFFLYDNYPEIYNYVYEAKSSYGSPKKPTEKEQEKFSRELMTFMAKAFSVSPENVLTIMEEETLLLKSFIDFKSSFLSLIEYKEFSEIGFAKIGNAVFMRVSFIKQKPFDLLIPLIRGQGKIFKVTFDKNENLGTVSSKFYKFNLEGSDWFSEQLLPDDQKLTTLEVFDIFSSEKYQTLFANNELAQSLYAFYFEKSVVLLQKGDPVELQLWKNKISKFIKLLEVLPVMEGEEGQEEIKAKLFQNFRDLLDALENSNFEYFGISSTATV